METHVGTSSGFSKYVTGDPRLFQLDISHLLLEIDSEEFYAVECRQGVFETALNQQLNDTIVFTLENVFSERSPERVLTYLTTIHGSTQNRHNQQSGRGLLMLSGKELISTNGLLNFSFFGTRTPDAILNQTFQPTILMTIVINKVIAA